MQRDEGYYWVKMSWGEWNIEHWKGGKWDDHGCKDGNDYYISFFKEIDENRIERTEGAILPDGDYDPIMDNPLQYLSDNPYLCKPD